ncbi:hypothetical protein BT96DRAFT_822927, partial [Gymnopus androsaceus JB14]
MGSESRYSPELFDAIIDFLHNDTEALFRCSLVCRSWVPTTRYHLFRCIHIT